MFWLLGAVLCCVTRLLASFAHKFVIESELCNSHPTLHLSSLPINQQVAPGIPDNRPQSGSQPIRSVDHSHSGYATSVAQKWYDNITVAGNTSLNPFFYGTYLGETKKGEPVTRSKKQAFQADAIGAMKQLGPEHFKIPHTFRLEWQPGRGGSLDWFSKSYKKVDENGTVFHMEGDGKGHDWEHSLHIPDFALDEAMGSKIPEEPSYVIFNTAVSSTWAFPYNVPDWCPKCYDCYNPKCQCSFNPGFCSMMKTGKVALKIDSVRVYQSRDDNAHPGNPHTVGCDPVEFPTREYIKGFEYRYMRNPPFVFEDKHPLRDVKTGGGTCKVDADCGGGGIETEEVDEEKTKEEVLDLDAKGGESSIRENQNPLAHVKDDDYKIQPQPKDRRLALDKPLVSTEAVATGGKDEKVAFSPNRKPKGQCVEATNVGLFGMKTESRYQCKCNEGYTGPHCLSVNKHDDKPGAEAMEKKIDFLFEHRASPYLTKFHIMIGGIFAGVFLAFLVVDNVTKRRR